MIRTLGTVWVLDTAETTYALRRLDTGHLEHLYYGPAIRISSEEEALCLAEQHAFQPGNAIVYDGDHPALCLEDLRLELSCPGKGDTREPFAELCFADGSRSPDFLFDHAEILQGKPMPETLPGSYAAESETVSTLILTLRERLGALTLELRYSVFETENVIVRSAVLHNEGVERVVIDRLMSTQLDFDDSDFCFTVFTGAWAREMHCSTLPVQAGMLVNGSTVGSSSSRANPFVMLSRPGADERSGTVYGMNLIYSGNHYEAVQVSPYGKCRFVSGIHPQGFRYLLEPGERFETPEAVMTCSAAGFGGMSGNMHAFVRNCIVRGQWKKKPRPVLMNSWEACYFKVSESRLLKMAEEGKKAGIELFVLDDGWFGKRDDDTSSLGDWQVNQKKLPNGLEGLCSKLNAMGLDFGIWVEPEMVSVNSDLYRSHAGWAMEIPGRPHAEGRNQRVLDLCNPEVVEELLNRMRSVFSSADIRYVKWDMNRIFSDCYSPSLPPERQGETAHRYIMGLYRLMHTLAEEFPQILFEGCSAGGNRFDLGILCDFPQIWASDNTDALCRAEIQQGCSYGYPQSVIGAHVSACPNHQTLRTTPLESRFAVAAFGCLGYECNFSDLSAEDKKRIAVQIALYKQWREVLQFGSFYRGRSGNLIEWTVVAPDRSRAVGMLFQRLAQPNSPFAQYFAAGLDPDASYSFTNRPLKYDLRRFGDLINTTAPIHIRQGSLLHQAAARMVQLPGETEQLTASGSLLMQAGVKLKQAFGGTGYDENVRLFSDFESRMYFMERKDS